MTCKCPLYSIGTEYAGNKGGMMGTATSHPLTVIHSLCAVFLAHSSEFVFSHTCNGIHAMHAYYYVSNSPLVWLIGFWAGLEEKEL